ncbi:MAG: hypothetical protein QXL70_03645 [Metallosphaera sp.]
MGQLLSYEKSFLSALSKASANDPNLFPNMVDILSDITDVLNAISRDDYLSALLGMNNLMSIAPPLDLQKLEGVTIKDRIMDWLNKRGITPTQEIREYIDLLEKVEAINKFYYEIYLDVMESAIFLFDYYEGRSSIDDLRNRANFLKTKYPSYNKF